MRFPAQLELTRYLPAQPKCVPMSYTINLVRTTNHSQMAERPKRCRTNFAIHNVHREFFADRKPSSFVCLCASARRTLWTQRSSIECCVLHLVNESTEKTMKITNKLVVCKRHRRRLLHCIAQIQKRVLWSVIRSIQPSQCCATALIISYVVRHIIICMYKYPLHKLYYYYYANCSRMYFRFGPAKSLRYVCTTRRSP